VLSDCIHKHFFKANDLVSQIKMNNQKSAATDVNITESTENGNITEHVSGTVCRFPSFCHRSAGTKCVNVTLKYCQSCSNSQAMIFIFAMAFLGLCVILTNGFLAWGSLWKKPRFPGLHYKIKASLAIADFTSGKSGRCVQREPKSYSMTSRQENDIYFKVKANIYFCYDFGVNHEIHLL